MKVLAKFRCGSVRKDMYGCEYVEFFPVSDKEGTNAFWAKATPGGRLEMTISQEGAQGAFLPGKSYLLEITPTED